MLAHDAVASKAADSKFCQKERLLLYEVQYGLQQYIIKGFQVTHAEVLQTSYSYVRKSSFSD